jgi:putative DNA primase/helicase
VNLLNALVETRGRKRMFNLAGDLDQLGELLAQTPEARLLIIDPVTAYLGSVNTSGNSAVRAVLSPLADLAAEYGVAVLFVTHFTKSGKGSAISRVTDSGAFTALSRTFWAVVPEVEDGRTTGRKLMVQIKNNIGGQIPGLAFTFEDVRLKGDVATSRIVWDGEVELTADDALSGSASSEASPRLDRAVAFLSEMLAEGPVLSAQIEAAASEAGISAPSRRRARERLGVTSYQVNREWWQKLPQTEVETE